jgi:hypothetical protein
MASKTQRCLRLIEAPEILINPMERRFVTLSQ